MWCCVVLRGAAWCCVVLRGAAWCCVVLRGAAWCCVVLRGVIPCCVVKLLHLHDVAPHLFFCPSLPQVCPSPLPLLLSCSLPSPSPAISSPVLLLLLTHLYQIKFKMTTPENKPAPSSSSVFAPAPEPKSKLGYYRLLSPSCGLRVSPICLGVCLPSPLSLPLPSLFLTCHIPQHHIIDTTYHSAFYCHQYSHNPHLFIPPLSMFPLPFLTSSSPPPSPPFLSLPFLFLLPLPPHLPLTDDELRYGMEGVDGRHHEGHRIPDP